MEGSAWIFVQGPELLVTSLVRRTIVTQGVYC